MYRCVAVLAGLLLAGPACAEPALLTFAMGKDQLVLAADDVSKLEPTIDLSGQPATLVTLQDAARTAFAAFSRKHVGSVIDVFVCDALIASPTLQTEIAGGHMILMGDTLANDAVLQGKLLRGSCK